MSPLDALTCALATYRLTKLAIDDEISAPLKNKIFEKHPPHSTSPAYILTCPWCFSMYAAPVTLVLNKKFPALNQVLALSAVTGLLYTKENNATL